MSGYARLANNSGNVRWKSNVVALCEILPRLLYSTLFKLYNRIDFLMQCPEPGFFFLSVARKECPQGAFPACSVTNFQGSERFDEGMKNFWAPNNECIAAWTVAAYSAVSEHFGWLFSRYPMGLTMFIRVNVCGIQWYCLVIIVHCTRHCFVCPVFTLPHLEYD